MQEVIRAFIADVRALLADAPSGPTGPTDETLARLGERMRSLVCHRAVLADHQAFLARLEGDRAARVYEDGGRRSEVLHTDGSGLTLVRSRFDPERATPVHSHGTWGVLGVYAGCDLHRAYVRRDGGTGAGPAELQLVDERVLGPGEVALIPRPPQDIHAQQGYGGEAAFELVLFGANAMVIPRLIFDLEAGSARAAIPGRG